MAVENGHGMKRLRNPIEMLDDGEMRFLRPMRCPVVRKPGRNRMRNRCGGNPSGEARHVFSLVLRGLEVLEIVNKFN